MHNVQSNAQDMLLNPLVDCEAFHKNQSCQEIHTVKDNDSDIFLYLSYFMQKVRSSDCADENRIIHKVHYTRQVESLGYIRKTKS